MISINLKKRIITTIILFLLVSIMFKSIFFLSYVLIVLGVLSLQEFFKIMQKIFKNKFFLLIINLLFSTYVFLLCFFFLYFSSSLNLKILIFFILLCCVASDIGGYIFGKMFNGPKLTKISPNKTIAGAIGSILATITLMSLFSNHFYKNFGLNIILIGLIISLLCQLGDLFFSYLKRKTKIKDTGKILPGHGGVLDRIDGILIGLPFGFIAFLLLY